MYPRAASTTGQAGQIGDRVDVGRALLPAERAVEVGANPAVAGVAGELADVIDVIDHVFRASRRRLGRRLAAHPAGHEHPRVERRADHGVALDEIADLVVGELAVVRHQRAAILWLAHTGPLKVIQRLPEAVIAEVSDIEDDAEPLHLAQQFAAARVEAAARVGAVRIHARPVVRRADGAQALGVGALQVLKRDDRVGAFEAQDVADRLVAGLAESARATRLDAHAERRAIDDLHDLAALLHRAIPRELPLRHRPGLLRRVPARQLDCRGAT